MTGHCGGGVNLSAGSHSTVRDRIREAALGWFQFFCFAKGGNMNLGETALMSGINAGLFSAGLIDTTGLGTGLLDAIGNVTGVKAGFNRLAAGDALGFCLIGCVNWNKYVQTLAVGGTVSRHGAVERLVVEAKVIDEKLYPDTARTRDLRINSSVAISPNAFG